MKKTVFILSFCVSVAFSGLVDGVSVLVNNMPITLFEIVKTAQVNKINNEEALQKLIDEKLQEWALSQRKITISDYEVNQQVEKIAANNNMTVTQFKDALKARYISFDDYKAGLKIDMEKRKLFEQIAQENFTPFDDKTLLDYYNTHKQEFAEPLKLNAVQYVSKDPKALEALVNSPLSAPSSNISKQEVHIDTSTLEQQVVNMLKAAKPGTFTPIMPIKGEYVTFYIQDVTEWSIQPFAAARNKVYERLAIDRQDEAIKEYFEKIKSSAQIRVLRLP